MLNIRAARSGEYEIIRDFYHSLIDEMQSSPYLPGWEKEIYPTNEYLRACIERGEMYVGEADGEIAAAMVVNGDCNESYAKAQWPVEAGAGEVFIIHILCVHPRHAGRGHAKALLDWAIADAKRKGKKAIRLDVLKGNLPAERLYRGKGFQYVGTFRMYYEDTDWSDFELFEYPLQ